MWVLLQERGKCDQDSVVSGWCANASTCHDGRQRFLLPIDVIQNLVNHLTLFDSRNDPHGTLAMPTNRDVNVEHPF